MYFWAVVMEGSVGCGFTSTPTSGKSFVNLKRTGNNHVPPFCCQLTSVLRLIPVGAKCSFCAEVWFFIGVRLGIAFVYFVSDHYVLEPFFPFIFDSLASMAEHAKNYLSALPVSFKRQPPLGMEEEAHWAHA